VTSTTYTYLLCNIIVMGEDEGVVEGVEERGVRGELIGDMEKKKFEE
jgi:hypothetical protein